MAGWAQHVGQRNLSRLGGTLAARFGRELLPSTPGGGPRPGPDGVTRADLTALAEALPPEALTTCEAARDAASAEGRVAGLVRQAEAMPCALPAVLRPGPEADPAALLGEAAAAGFEPEVRADRAGGQRHTGGARRAIGLDFSRLREAVGGETVQIGAGTSWGALCALAARRGEGVPLASLADRYPSPMDAVLAGLAEGAQVEWFRSLARTATLNLPPRDVGVVDRTWMMREAGAAEAALRRTLERYRPLYAETVPALDAQALRAAGLWRGDRRSARGGTALRLVFAGTRSMRLAELVSASWAIERAGGRVCHRGALPPAGALPALAVAAGAARIERAAGPDPAPALPQDAVVGRRLVALRGRLREQEIVWYPRDLTRSLEQLREVQGEAPPRGDGWDAVRAALERSLP